MKKYIGIILIAIITGFVFSGCEDAKHETATEKAQKAMQKDSQERVPYLPKNDVEFSNFNKAQELYDTPSTIIWCSVIPQSNSVPTITVPIAGKLTSSSVSYFRPVERVDWDSENFVVEAKSSDGMYHGNPPPYRYGFTPGGQYVDFYNLPTFCTTKPLNYQRQSVQVDIDTSLDAASKRAEQALKNGDNAQAQRILAAAAGN